MFIGECSHALDAKGRLIVPSKFREGLSNRFIITKSLDKCISIYTMEEWNIFSDKLMALPSLDSGARRVQRFFIGAACDCEPDNQNRIMIPANLREYAGITKEVVSVGLKNKIEIWSKENWADYNTEVDAIDEELADKLAQLGI